MLEQSGFTRIRVATDPSTWRRYVGDYVITDYEGTRTEATVYLEGDQLMGSIVDPENPDIRVISRLRQLYLDTFLYDSDGDGRVDNDITFCSTRGEPGFVMWTRNRLAVGERDLTPRSAGRGLSP